MAKVRIKVKNPGILEVPEGKHVWDLRKKDIQRLVKKKGKLAISRAVNNLWVWNKNKRTKTALKIKQWVKKAKKWLETM